MGSLPGGSWTLGITEVSGVALLALGDNQAVNQANNQADADRRAALDFLRRSRLPDGTWPSYWWHTPLYATSIALSALSALSILTKQADFAHDPLNEELRRTLMDFQAVGAFETALQLLCCQKLQMHVHCSALAHWLIEQQQAAGGWPPSAFLRLANTEIDEPSQFINSGTIYVDHNGIFTTATVIAALSRQVDAGF